MRAINFPCGRSPREVVLPADGNDHGAVKEGVVLSDELMRELLGRWRNDLEEVRMVASKSALPASDDQAHTQIQGWLRDLGRALGYEVWIAQNDRGRMFGADRLWDGCLERLPSAWVGRPGADAVRLIDVLWLDAAEIIVAAFEVEHTTSIYSGIVRMLNLALGGHSADLYSLYLVAPDKREGDVRAQIARPAFSLIADLSVRYLPYSGLERHREALGRFGGGVAALERISHRLT